MSDRAMAKMLAPMARALRAMLGRGVVSVINAATKMQTVQLELLAGEIKDDVEHFEPYGFTSHARPGAEVVAGFFDGDRSHGVALVVADRRFRLSGLAEGEVALHDDQGQTIVIGRSGITITGGNKPVTVTGTPSLTVNAATTAKFNTPVLEVTGMIKAAGNIMTTAGQIQDPAGTLSALRNAHNGHTHSDPQGGSVGLPSLTA